MHTVAELADLVAAERYQLAKFDAIKACPAWAAADPQGYGAWAANLYDATEAMNKALSWAQGVVNGVPEAIRDVTPARLAGFVTDPWGDVVAAAHPFVDLLVRYKEAGYCQMPDMSGMPHPKAPDLDLKAYNWTGQALDKLKEAPKSAAPYVVGGIVVVAVIAGIVYVSRLPPEPAAPPISKPQLQRR
jgi:hypothetical protein